MFNLQEKYPKYKYEFDEGYEEDDNPEYYRNLICRYGIVSWFGNDKLYVRCVSNESLLRKLREIPGCEEMILGMDEAVYHIHHEHMRKVLRVLKPKLNDAESKKFRARFK